MNKRGQVYILAVILIGFFLFSLLSKPNFIKRIIIDDDFVVLARNFDVESSRVINNLLGSTEIVNEFAKFTKQFSDFARTQNPDFEIISVFKFEGLVYFCNFMSEDINVCSSPSATQCPTFEGCFKTVTDLGSASVDGQNFVSLDFKKCETTADSSQFCHVVDGATTGTISFIIGDIKYEVDVPEENKPELIIVSKEDIGDQRRVFVEDGFVKGKKK